MRPNSTMVRTQSVGLGGVAKNPAASQELSLLWSRLTERDKECAALRSEIAPTPEASSSC